jgi:poly-beta-1,6-N-acetyl-D-glucosamine synthase
MFLVKIASLLTAAIAFLALFQVYALYPLSLLCIKMFSRKKEPSLKSKSQPTVVMICAAHNEDQVLKEKIKNFLALDYPPEKLTILFGSDGSTDRTNEILEAETSERIHVRYFDRRGKAAVINELMRMTDAEIVVFSDANTIYHKDAVKTMVRHFEIPSVGGVCGNLSLSAPKESSGMVGEEKYWLFETWLKKMESGIYSLIGATGGIYAIRRALYEDQPTNIRIADDLLLPLRITAKKFRIVFEEQAHAYEETNVDVFLEFHRRIRNAVGSIAILSFWRELSPGFTPYFKYSFFSHKLLRWLLPFFLVGLFIATGVLAMSDHGCIWPFALQVLLYGIGVLGLIAEKLHIRTGIIMIPAYFVLANAAVFLGWFKRSTLGKQATWSTHRSTSSA